MAEREPDEAERDAGDDGPPPRRDEHLESGGALRDDVFVSLISLRAPSRANTAVPGWSTSRSLGKRAR